MIRSSCIGLMVGFLFEHDLSENQLRPRIKPGAGFFGIMLYLDGSAAEFDQRSGLLRRIVAAN